MKKSKYENRLNGVTRESAWTADEILNRDRQETFMTSPTQKTINENAILRVIRSYTVYHSLTGSNPYNRVYSSLIGIRTHRDDAIQSISLSNS